MSITYTTWWLIHATKLFYLLLIETNLSSDDFQFRLWDFSPDCHDNLYRKFIYPIGMDLVEQMGIGVAIYCAKVSTVLIRSWIFMFPPRLVLVALVS